MGLAGEEITGLFLGRAIRWEVSTSSRMRPATSNERQVAHSAAQQLWGYAIPASSAVSSRVLPSGTSIVRPRLRSTTRWVFLGVREKSFLNTGGIFPQSRHNRRLMLGLKRRLW